MVHVHRNPRGRERLYPTNLAHKFNVREWCTCRERQTSADTSRFVFIRRKSLRAFVAPLYANQNGVVVVAAARPSHLHTRGMLSLRLFFPLVPATLFSLSRRRRFFAGRLRVFRYGLNLIRWPVA